MINVGWDDGTACPHIGYRLNLPRAPFHINNLWHCSTRCSLFAVWKIMTRAGTNLNHLKHGVSDQHGGYQAENIAYLCR